MRCSFVLLRDDGSSMFYYLFVTQYLFLYLVTFLINRTLPDVFFVVDFVLMLFVKIFILLMWLILSFIFLQSHVGVLCWK